MKILLIGEYSNLHWTLANGLRDLGHSVVVASDGDGFKNFQRNINISLKSDTRVGQLTLVLSILKSLNQFRGFDVVQLINPMFTRIHHLNPYIYRFLRKHNNKIFLGAFGDDYFYTKACVENELYRYSEFYVNGKPTHLKANEDLKNTWIGTFRHQLNIEIADTCNGIISCLYEYFTAYESNYKEKLIYIPLPVNLKEIQFYQLAIPEIVNFFIGINKDRMEIKGSAIFLEVLDELKKKYNNLLSVDIASSIPYGEYKKRMSDADVVLDQIYSYSPAMNGLLSLAEGKVLVTNAESEMYRILNETENEPIINIKPSPDSIYNKIESLLLNKDKIPELSSAGRSFVEKHHDHIQVAKQYLNFWQSR